jgi:serine/threonine-protein kinase
VECLDENRVVEFLEGRLDETEQALVEKHVDECAECRAVRAVVSRLLAQVGSGTAAEPRPRVSPWCRQGDVIGGKYRVERELGSGGMGVVVAATHLALEQWVAIKLMHPEAASHPEAKSRFLREARAAARLRSEHVVRVFDIGELSGGTPYFVMEHLDGEDLSTLLRRRGTLPPAEAIGWVLQAIDALIEAHLANIVHRDLKPANLFVTRRSDGAPLLKVLDFGISKYLDGGSISTDSHIVLGSPVYMSPEQFRSARDVDGRADVWGLGCILHELVSGQPPFGPGPLAKVAYDVVNSPAPKLSPPVVERVVARCLEKDRERRFAHVGELRAALHEALSQLAPPTEQLQLAPPRRARWPMVAALTLPLAGFALGRAASMLPPEYLIANEPAAPVTKKLAVTVVPQIERAPADKPARTRPHKMVDPFASRK